MERKMEKRVCGKGSTWNPNGFYLEPKRVLQMVILWGQLKNLFRLIALVVF
jgi:hypothetical protein